MKKITLTIVLTILLVTMISCSMSQNYNDPHGPVYEGEYAGEAPSFDDRLTVVTWNVRHGEQVKAVIKTLQEADVLRDADILLLQEMDEVGVKRIARALSYNYVFYPAIFKTHH